MPDDPSTLAYRSRGDALGDDVVAARRSLRTWVILLTVWAVGLVVWTAYLALVAFLVLRVLA